jgi:hypothetical protein
MNVDGVGRWLILARSAPTTTLGRWRAVDEYSFVLDMLLQRHRVAEAEKTFLLVHGQPIKAGAALRTEGWGGSDQAKPPISGRRHHSKLIG